MTYKKLLLDVDGTLLDFDASAAKSLEILFEQRGYPYTDHVFERYDVINAGLWERYEKGEIPRARVLVERFTLLFEDLGIPGEDPEAFEHSFRAELERNPVWMRGAVELLDQLFPKYDMYIVTNGVASTQKKRLAATGLDRYVRDVFISEAIGAQKPQKAYFDYCLSHIGEWKPGEVLLIGDSLSADILGANNAGIPSVWFNPTGKPNPGPAKPDREIRDLAELLEIL